MEQDLATRIRKHREGLKLSQYQAAELWKVPHATLKSWENGTTVPTDFSMIFLNNFTDGAKDSAAE